MLCGAPKLHVGGAPEGALPVGRGRAASERWGHACRRALPPLVQDEAGALVPAGVAGLAPLRLPRSCQLQEKRRSPGDRGVGGEIGGAGTRGGEGHPEKRYSGTAGTQECSGTEPQVGAGEGRRETDPPPSPALTERPESRLRPNMAPPSRVRARVRGSGRPEPPPPLRRAPAPSSPPPGRQAPPREGPAAPRPAPPAAVAPLQSEQPASTAPRRRSASQHEGEKRRPRRDGIVLLRRGKG